MSVQFLFPFFYKVFKLFWEDSVLCFIDIKKKFIIKTLGYTRFSLSVSWGKYPWERYEPPNPPNYGLNSTATVLLGEWLLH